MKKRFTVVLALLMMLALSPASASPVITTDSLPTGMAGVFYSAALTAQGEQPLSFELAYSNDGTNGLPGGLKLAKNGTLYGNPDHAGTFTFTVFVLGAKGEAFREFTIQVRPFDENQLRKGGEKESVLGEGTDSITGIANALSGGRVTMQNDGVYFIDRKGYLYESSAPYTKAARRFKATAYDSMDSLNDSLYYYQRYLDTKGTSPDGSDNTFVTRIARDPLGAKGRSTLASLTQKEITALSVTNEIILFVKGENPGTMVLLPIEGGGDSMLHAYHAGHELDIAGAIPYNGYAYFKSAPDGTLYRMYLDGERAERLTEREVGTFTIARRNGEDMLCYTDDTGAIIAADLDGSNAQPLSSHKASVLNADENSLYFIDPENKNRAMRMDPAAPETAEELSDVPCDQLYVFEKAVVLHKKGGDDFILLSKEGSSEPVYIGKAIKN